MTKIHRLADYAPPRFHVEAIGLDVELDPDRTLVEATIDFVRTAAAAADAPLLLDGVGLEIEEIRLDGEALSEERYRYVDDTLTIWVVPDKFRLETRVAISPRANRSGSGLFLVDGKLATQCEAEGFRRLTFFPDRPDVLARYRVRLTADEALFPVLLSNGNPVANGKLSGGRHWALWEDPHPKPSYIFAIAAGQFASIEEEFETASGRKVKLGVFANKAAIGDCVFALGALRRALRWDEEVFGLEYDLQEYNIVALHGWAGATENKGLNIFGASGIVANPKISTDDELITIERVIGHEVFHNWTGNRVTCRDWFQLSLKEGLTRYRDQLFMESRVGTGAWRIEMVKALRRNQFPEDDGAAVHPVQLSEYHDIDNFYSNTVYDKGAEIIRMLAALVGDEPFRSAVRLFLERHDGEAVTVGDFLSMIEHVSGRDLTSFGRWYTQAGRSHILATGDYAPELRRYTLTLRQQPPALPETFPLPLPLLIPARARLIGAEGQDCGPERLLELSSAEENFVFEDVSSPPIMSLMRRFSAPVSLVAKDGDVELGKLVAYDDDPFARWDAMQRLGVQAIRRLAHDPVSPAVDVFCRTVGNILADRRIDPFCASQLLALPDEPVLSEGLETIPLDEHQQARRLIRRKIAETFESELMARREELAATGTAHDAAADIGRRKLRNACLDCLMALERTDVDELCLDQVRYADNMTDSFSAMGFLVDRNCPQRDEALAWFHDRWKREPTVIDKWFGIQALSRAEGAIERIIALTSHSDFDVDNMARLLAFYGSLFRQNRVSFHDISGKGYAFLGDTLLAMDALGRGGASWVMPQINQWRRHDPVRRQLMQSELERIAGTSTISDGLREVVEAALT